MLTNLKIRIAATPQTPILQPLIRLTKENRYRSYAFTIVAQTLVSVGLLIAFKLVGRFFGTVGFGEYTIARRAISILSFPLLLGMGISMPRYIGRFTSSKMHSALQDAYFIACLLISAPILTVFFVVGMNVPNLLSQTFFGSSTFNYMTWPILLASSGLYVQTLAYSYYQGHLQMWKANLFQIITIGIVPPLIILSFGHSVASIIAFTGFSWIGISCGVIVRILLQMELRAISLSCLWTCIKQLISYGIPRLPGEFGLFGLFAIPTFIIAHRFSVEEAGFFSFTLTLLQMIGSLFTAIGIVLLPYISRLAAEGQWNQTGKIVSKILQASIALCFVAVTLFALGLPVFTTWFMGQFFIKDLTQIRMLLFGSIPYVVYIILRNPIDAVAQWPYNSINLVATLAIIILLAELNLTFLSPYITMLSGLCLLGGLSFYSWLRAIQIYKHSPA